MFTVKRLRPDVDILFVDPVFNDTVFQHDSSKTTVWFNGGGCPQHSRVQPHE